MKSVATLFRNAYSGLPTSVWLLSSVMLVNRSGSMVIFFLSVYLNEQLDLSYEKVGVVMACFGAGSFLGIFLGGRLVDKIGYYPVMLASLFAGGASMFVLSAVTDFYLLCIGFFVLSLLNDAFRPANMAAVSHYSGPAKYTRSIALNRLAINLGFSVGPALGGILSDINYKYIFWADGFTSIGAGLVLLLFLDNSVHKAQPKKESIPEHESRSPFTDSVYLWFLPLVTIYAISFFQFFTTMSLYYRNVQGFDKSEIGWILSLNGLIVAAVEMIFIYKFEKKWSVRNFISLGAALLALTYLLVIFVDGLAWLIVLTVIISFSEIFAMPFMTTFMDSRTGSGNKGRYAALYAMAWSVAQVCMPIIATQIMSHWGYDVLWMVLAALGLFVCFAIRLVARPSAMAIPEGN